MIVGATDILGRQRYHIIGVMFKCDEKNPAAIGTLLKQPAAHDLHGALHGPALLPYSTCRLLWCVGDPKLG